MAVVDLGEQDGLAVGAGELVHGHVFAVGVVGWCVRVLIDDVGAVPHGAVVFTVRPSGLVECPEVVDGLDHKGRLFIFGGHLWVSVEVRLDTVHLNEFSPVVPVGEGAQTHVAVEHLHLDVVVHAGAVHDHHHAHLRGG